MPVKTTWEERGVYWTLTGVVPFGEILDTIQGFYQDKRSDKARFQIIDALNIDSFEVSETDMKCVAAFDFGASQTMSKIKVACIAAEEEAKEVFEIYIESSKKLSSSWQFKLCESVKEARQWINS